MYFKIVKDCPTRDGELIYIENERSIDFRPNQGGGYCIVAGYLNIIFDDRTKCAKQIWGLYSHPSNWIPQSLHRPDIQPGSFTFIDETIEDPQDIERIEGSLNWDTFYDSQKQWLCFGNVQEENDDVAVEFATNCVAVLHHNQLKALWLKLTFYKEYPEN